MSNRGRAFHPRDREGREIKRALPAAHDEILLAIAAGQFETRYLAFLHLVEQRAASIQCEQAA